MARRAAIVAVIWALLQLYVGQRLLGFDASPGWTLAGWLGVAVLVFAPWAALLSGRVARLPGKTALAWIGYLSLGISSLLIVFVAAGDLLQTRRWLELPVFAGVVLSLTAVIVVLGLWRSSRPRVVEQDVAIADLPTDLEGFRIVQISDLHVGPTLKGAFVEKVVRTVNDLRPDLIALTGDVADGLVPLVQDDVASLAELKAPHGKYFVTGNHEYYWDAPCWVREMERLGFVVLVNRHRVIQRGAATLVIAGITDHTASAHLPGHRSDPAAAIAGAPQSDIRLLLAHQPAAAFTAQRLGFDLQLSGHTHGGQFFPFNVLVKLFQPYVAGLHRLEQMWIYVSRGTGYWGPPLRLGAPSEITLLRLVRPAGVSRPAAARQGDSSAHRARGRPWRTAASTAP